MGAGAYMFAKNKPDEELVKQNICSQVKQLVKDAEENGLAMELLKSEDSDSVYRFKQNAHELSNELHKNNFSVCECVSSLMERKYEKALKKTQEVFSLSDKEIEDFKQHIALIQEKTEGQNPTIEFNKPAKILTFMIDWVTGQFKDNKESRQLFEKMLEPRMKALDINMPLKVVFHPIHGSGIGKNPSGYIFLFNSSDIPKDRNKKNIYITALINHELTHLKNKDSDTLPQYLSLCSGESPENDEDLMAFYNNFPHPEVMELYIRSSESIADRKVPACEDCQDALCSFEFWKKMFEEYGSEYDDADKTHPRLSKRFLWAAAIYWMREEENRLTKSFEP